MYKLIEKNVREMYFYLKNFMIGIIKILFILKPINATSRHIGILCRPRGSMYVQEYVYLELFIIKIIKSYSEIKIADEIITQHLHAPANCTKLIVSCSQWWKR